MHRVDGGRCFSVEAGNSIRLVDAGLIGQAMRDSTPRPGRRGGAGRSTRQLRVQVDLECFGCRESDLGLKTFYHLIFSMAQDIEMKSADDKDKDKKLDATKEDKKEEKVEAPPKPMSLKEGESGRPPMPIQYNELIHNPTSHPPTEIKLNLILLDRAVHAIEPRFSARVLRTLTTLRKKLEKETLKEVIESSYPRCE